MVFVTEKAHTLVAFASFTIPLTHSILMTDSMITRIANNGMYPANLILIMKAPK